MSQDALPVAWVVTGNNTCCGCSALVYYGAYDSKDKAEAQRQEVIRDFVMDEADIWLEPVPNPEPSHE